ncbi:hypothetical protein PPL_08872 [Heterostelium album PN500]|uniref:Transmembrane protein n=1 Tax=Heterostelium pallidum (strain ATCC 26659 / Pp 5 / PN500) TaxID=670386 RepID=D3BJZ2_HETP5|nr:hypothetical protein PPL_08872 [Heterostelium album PN500]EFA78222.1 hypothetical protein PPL_08872 [Heterostelium album PN500]|eukprot:XP_020430347.1 hypothetical protein PPL_08872 [Heterostelium album PN500]
MPQFSNFKSNKYTSITILMLIGILALVIAACVTGWYRVNQQVGTGRFANYYFYPTQIKSTIVQDGNEVSAIDFDWGSRELTNSHQIINACVAMAAISWLVYLATTILAVLVQIEVVQQIGSISAWLLVKIMIIIGTVLLLVSVGILGGFTPAMRKDINNANTVTDVFTPCVDTCEFHWAGSNNEVKYGPYTGWIIAIVTFFFSVAASIFPWFLKDTGFGTPSATA